MKNDEKKGFLSGLLEGFLHVLALPFFIVFDVLRCIFVIIFTFLPYIIPIGLIVLGYFLAKLFI